MYGFHIILYTQEKKNIFHFLFMLVHYWRPWGDEIKTFYQMWSFQQAEKLYINKYISTSSKVDFMYMYCTLKWYVNLKKKNNNNKIII
jgi:hypothetical protein